MGGEHQDRSGPWEESTKTVVQKADGQRVQFMAFTADFTITFLTVGSDTGSKEETDSSEKGSRINALMQKK